MNCEELDNTIQTATFAIVSIIIISTYVIINSQLGYRRLLNKYIEKYGDLAGYPDITQRNIIIARNPNGRPGNIAGYPGITRP